MDKIDPHKSKAQALEAFLVASARTGDRHASDQLVRLVSPRLLAHAHRLLGDPENARDVVQSAWIDILAALPRLREIRAFRTFALRIVSRKVAASIKDRQRDRKLTADMAEQAETNTPPLGDQMADANTVRAAIESLSPDHQATLRLFYLEDLNVAEVAAALDVPTGTVKTRLMHARAKLRAILEGKDHDKD